MPLTFSASNKAPGRYAIEKKHADKRPPETLDGSMLPLRPYHGARDTATMRTDKVVSPSPPTPNKYGRIRTVIRQKIYKHLSKQLTIFLDPYLRKLRKNEAKNKNKINAWIQDQYEHPVETLHTFDEVLLWFKKNKIEFISSIPQADMSSISNIFEKKDYGNLYLRLISQLTMIFTSHGSEGGLFCLIGKKLKR